MRRLGRHLRQNLIAYTALFFALGGTAYAVGPPLITGAQIQDNSIESVDLKDDDVASIDVKDGTLQNADIRNPNVTVTAGEGLTGGGTILLGTRTTLALADGSVTPSKFGTIPSAVITNATDQSSPHNTLTTLSFDTETFDNANLHDSSNNSRLTAPIDGTYLATAYIPWGALTLNGDLSAQILKNGSFSVPPVAAETVDVETARSNSLSAAVRLNAGEFLEVKVAQNSGSTDVMGLDTLGLSFTLTWLGP